MSANVSMASPSDNARKLIARVESRKAHVGVVGIGYVGLAVATAAASSGYNVVGYDNDAGKVAQIRRSDVHVETVDRVVLRSVLTTGRLVVTNEPSDLTDSEVLIICVPTPLAADGSPSTEAVRKAARLASDCSATPALVIVESTMYPRATEEIVASAARRAGRHLSKDLFLACSPERVDPGNWTRDVSTTPKLLAGYDDDSTAIAKVFYNAFVKEVHLVPSMVAAELAKLFENAFRAVNIALVEELEAMCHAQGIEARAVLAACATKPFGFMAFEPGVGVGGHCIAVDPWYLTWWASTNGSRAPLLSTALSVSRGRTAEIRRRIERSLGAAGKTLRGARVVVIGVTYKANVADIRESAAVRLVEQLVDAGALVVYHDPHVPTIDLMGARLESEKLNSELMHRSDVVVAAVRHDSIDWSVVTGAARLIDLCGCDA